MPESAPAAAPPSASPASDIDAHARLLAAVADPTRLAIVHVLRTGPRCVGELQGLIPIAANLLSYHLKVLRDVELIMARRRSRWVDYSLTSGALDRLHDALP